METVVQRLNISHKAVYLFSGSLGSYSKWSTFQSPHWLKKKKKLRLLLIEPKPKISALIQLLRRIKKTFPGGSAGKESTCSAGYLGSIPGLGRSPGEESGYPLQYSGLENSMGWIVHGVTKSWTQLSDFH